MRCKHARHEIALSIGKDLAESAERKLQRHLATCPDCRDYRREMEEGLSVLQEAGDEPHHRSIWSSVENRLAELPEPRAWQSFSLAPAFAVVAACLIMYVSVDSAWVSRQSSPVDVTPVSAPQVVPTTPIVAPADRGQSDFIRELQRMQGDQQRKGQGGAPGFGRRHILEYR